jgi:hypothetical protein
MALNFPSSPATNDEYTLGTKTWVWNGLAWALKTSGNIDNTIIGATTPAAVTGTDVVATVNLKSLYSSGDEGGEIFLAKPQTSTTLAGTGVTIDIYQNKLRFFEDGGTYRGAYIDLSSANTGVGSNLLNGSSDSSSWSKSFAMMGA